ncbi:hypothetical protein H5410_031212 [Solanum commersonii]|uniref:Uncharacterized protein n=1 Tax=Solanum commersonii TaxID=4109 RepID=A0A9J5YHR5_SOLCO|nr:hypothetical protein H5410_031212 [Solanum commersonii]
MSLEHGREESLEYHPKPYYDRNDDDDDAPTWPKLADSRYNLQSKGKMADKDEFNCAANIMILIENPEGS